MPVDVEGYRDYVSARLEPLRRTAYLLCGDWHTADDLVSAALVKLLRHWSRVSVMDNRTRTSGGPAAGLVGRAASALAAGGRLGGGAGSRGRGRRHRGRG